MKKPMSLRLRLTLLCAALLTLCCLLLTLTNNLSAVQMAHSVQAVPLLPAQTAEADAHTDFPMASLEISETVRQARGVFHLQSLLAMAAVLAAGLFLIYRLVGKVLAPLDELAGQIRGRTAEDLERPLAVPDSGDEVAELARAFNQMSRRLNQVFVMQKNFSHNAAHEFRTPLAVLKTRIGLFRKKRDFRPEAVQDFLQIMEGEVDRLSAMVSSLLELTNLEQMEHGERLSAEQLIQGAADELALPAAERQISVLVDVSPCTLTGNERLLHRAVFNLLENAVKYNKPGGSVTVHVFGNEREANLTISDTGIGIPEEHLPRLFERFYRVDKGRSRAMGGTGLGLAIVKHIVRGMNGEIEVHSKFGEGTEFLVTLPIAPPPSQEELEAGGDDEVMDITDEERSKEQRERDESRRRGIHEDAPRADEGTSGEGI